MYFGIIKNIFFIILLSSINYTTKGVLIEEFDDVTWEVQTEVKPHSHLEDFAIVAGILSRDDKEAQQELDDYFNTGLLATRTSKNSSEEMVRLEYPHTLDELTEFYIDKDISNALRFVFPKLSLENIPFFWMRNNHYFETLNDNWTLYSWSNFMHQHYSKIRQLNQRIVIYHLDDHSDMMPPLVYRDGPFLKTMLQDNIISMNEPNTVERAIDLGCIPVGAFLTVFLYQYQDLQIEVRHLTNRRTYITGQTHQHISYGTTPDKLFPNKKRIHCRLKPEKSVSKHKYFATDKLSELIENFDFNAVNFLHIDLDYFNDRFDGDIHWRQRSRIFDPPDVINSIVETLKELSKFNWSNIVAAYSPGFFPAEFWGSTSKLLHENFVLQKK